MSQIRITIASPEDDTPENRNKLLAETHRLNFDFKKRGLPFMATHVSADSLDAFDMCVSSRSGDCDDFFTRRGG